LILADFLADFAIIQSILLRVIVIDGIEPTMHLLLRVLPEHSKRDYDHPAITINDFATTRILIAAPNTEFIAPPMREISTIATAYGCCYAMLIL